MSRLSSILICPAHPLREMPDSMRDALRSLFEEWIRGMDLRSQRRLRRLVAQIARAEAGEGFQLFRMEERSGPFHRRHRVVLERLFAQQERYGNIDALHDWLKFKCYFVTWGEGKRGQPMPVPRSTEFAKCSEDDLREFHTRMVDLLHDPAIQRHLWKHLKANQRADMVETVLAEKEDQHQ